MNKKSALKRGGLFFYAESTDDFYSAMADLFEMKS